MGRTSGALVEAAIDCDSCGEVGSFMVDDFSLLCSHNHTFNNGDVVWVEDHGNGCGSNETPTKWVDGNLHRSSIREVILFGYVAVQDLGVDSLSSSFQLPLGK
ncbi:hypothetical protein Tco_1370409 [Tanacetum coccineum]